MTPPEKTVPPLRAVRTEARCPICGKPASTGYRPFCCKRCADVDLGRWLKETYRVPVDAQAGDDEDSASGGATGQGS